MQFRKSNYIVQKSQKFPATSRIKKRKEFLAMQENSRKVHSEHFLLIYKKQQPTAITTATIARQTRLGITVTKKVDKRAVCRNKIKRLVREIFRKELSQIQNNLDILIIAKVGTSGISYSQAEQELLFLFKKARIMRY